RRGATVRRTSPSASRTHRGSAAPRRRGRCARRGTRCSGLPRGTAAHPARGRRPSRREEAGDVKLDLEAIEARANAMGFRGGGVGEMLEDVGDLVARVRELEAIAAAERALRLAIVDLADKRARSVGTEGDHALVGLAEDALRALGVEP